MYPHTCMLYSNFKTILFTDMIFSLFLIYFQRVGTTINLWVHQVLVSNAEQEEVSAPILSRCAFLLNTNWIPTSSGVERGTARK